MEAPKPTYGDKSEINFNFNSVDRFSLLPEDIVCNILSRLTVKEAVLTSILSSKFRHSWRFFSGFMDFNFKNSFGSCQMESYRFVSLVNRVLRSHESSTLEGFRVCFSPDLDSQCEIDSWIKFAIQKRVKHLELDLNSFENLNDTEICVFPSYVSNFSSLKSLRLNRVDVTGEILQHLLLSRCPFLELLSISNSPSLTSLKLFGFALKLQHLEVFSCFRLKELVVSAASLMSLEYYGPEINIPFNNVPNLVEVSLGGSCSRLIVDYLQQFLLYKLQIETFKINLGNGHLFRRDFPRSFPTLSYVKHLEVAAAVFTDSSCLLPPCAALLKACPLLQAFTLEILYEIPGYSTLLIEIPKDYAHSYLNVVEVVGFLGNLAEVKVVEYLLRNAVVLEKMIIETNKSPILKETDKYQTIRQCALELERKVPPGVKFVVL